MNVHGLSDKYAGKELIALDISSPLSPMFEVVIEPGSIDPESLRQDLETKLKSMFDDIEGLYRQWNWPVMSVKIHGRSGIIPTPEERTKKWDELFTSTPEEEAEAEAQAAAWTRKHITEHPDNGKLGYWIVDGHDKSVIVKNVTTAQEAVDKAKLEFTGWESECYWSAKPSFIGKELPDVFPI